MTSPPSFFTAADNHFQPTALAVSHWSPTMLTGPATCGLIAREVERHVVSDDMVPARLTIDLFAPVPVEPLTVTCRTVRQGSRIRVVEATLAPQTTGNPVAHATAVFLRQSCEPDGRIWKRDTAPTAPTPNDPALAAATTVPIFGSDDHPTGWSIAMDEHQNASRKRMWSKNITVIEGEEPSPFVVAVIVGEATSLVTNWGTEGIHFINADVTITLGRLPTSREIGIEADNHISSNGVAACSGTLYDRDGMLGTSVAVALANSRRRIRVDESNSH